MDVHKPKPVRNWREFLKEYAIIVVGVLTALAAEQAVEWLHWRNEVAQARAALRAEMAPITDFYGARIAMAACVDRKLDIVAVKIAEVAAGVQPDLHGMAFLGLGAPAYDSEWQSERSSQVLTHFPRRELALMSTFYGQVKDTHDWMLEEAAAWAHLAVLQEAAQKLGPPDLAQMRANYHLARRYQGVITRNAVPQLEVAARLGLKPAALTPAQIAERCNRGGVLPAKSDFKADMNDVAPKRVN